MGLRLRVGHRVHVRRERVAAEFGDKGVAVHERIGDLDAFAGIGIEQAIRIGRLTASGAKQQQYQEGRQNPPPNGPVTHSLNLRTRRLSFECASRQAHIALANERD